MNGFQFISSDFPIHIFGRLIILMNFPLIVYCGKTYENISSVVSTLHFWNKINLVIFYLFLTLFMVLFFSDF